MHQIARFLLGLPANAGQWIVAVEQAGASFYQQRVHGGALPSSAAVGDLEVRAQVSPQEKINLGRFGASIIQPGQVVILDGGTTAIQVARHLHPDLRATIVTHSPKVALEVANHAFVDIIVLGGRLFRHSMVNVGAAVIDAASRLRADLYFMGVTGAHPAAGLSTGDAEEAAVKRTLHQRAAETIVLASTEKLMAASAFVVAPLRDVSLLIVPAKTPERSPGVTSRWCQGTEINAKGSFEIDVERSNAATTVAVPFDGFAQGACENSRRDPPWSTGRPRLPESAHRPWPNRQTLRPNLSDFVFFARRGERYFIHCSSESQGSKSFARKHHEPCTLRRFLLPADRGRTGR